MSASIMVTIDTPGQGLGDVLARTPKGVQIAGAGEANVPGLLRSGAASACTHREGPCPPAGEYFTELE